MVSPKTGRPHPGAYYNTPRDGEDLSSDWSKYHTPEQSRALIGLQYRTNTTEFKDPNKFYISAFINKEIYDLNCDQWTEYNPIINDPEVEGKPNNIAHCAIYGNKTDEEVRLKFVGISKWAIGPED